MKQWWQHLKLKHLPMHMRGDEYNKILVKEQGLTKCTECGGTGNQLLSMYQKCNVCDGTGNMEKRNLQSIESEFMKEKK